MEYSYIYTASGEKLAKRMKDNTYQYYAGNMVYNSSKVLDYMIMEDGLTRNTNGAYTYEYFLQDHLGSTRVMFQPINGEPSILQVADYYPFGTTFNPIEPNTNGNKYLYNGKEKQDDVLGGVALDWYDYGARFYDPMIGRWHSVDPLAEKHFETSTYVYCGNNPVNRIDPDGMDWFQNNQTGDVVYVSSLRQGAEEGMEKGWQWMGANGMFMSDKDDIANSDMALATKNGGSFKIEPNDFSNPKDDQLVVSMLFEGDKAKDFMQDQGFDFKPTQQIRYESETDFYPPSGVTVAVGTQIYITEKSEYVRQGAIEDRYTPMNDVLVGRYWDTVNRFQISYTTNGIKKALDSLMPYIGNHDLRIPEVYPSLKSYPWNNKLINMFLKINK